MKKIQIIIVAISLATSSVCAQDVIDYYKKINEGKIFASESDFESAIKSYQQAFENFDHVFARDCYNAIELAVLANDTIKLDFFITKAVTQGIRINDLEKSGKLDDYLESAFYKNIKETEDSLALVYNSKINWDLRSEINQMFLEDQSMREKYYNSILFKRNVIRTKWEALNSKQVERLVEITKQYGFPGENLIGLDRNEMHPKVSTTNYSAGMPIVILIHHFSQPNQSYDKLLIEEVRKGNLYNEHFAAICDFEAEFGKDKFENFGYYGLRHQPRVPDKNALNSRREEIGILKFEQLNALNQIKNLTKFWNRLY